ncbi:MAG: hypothetical protein M3Q39_09150 [Actinomycetota bacterium]|nr:hypothetical protein [Actinomycetota bacterium]
MQNADPTRRSAYARLATLLPDLRDVLALVGLALLTVGAGMVYRPAAYLVPGFVLFVIGLFGVPKWRS